MGQSNPRKLIVEGADDKRIIPQLIELNGVIWEPTHKKYIVDIFEPGGIEPLLEQGYLKAQSQSHGLKYMGVIADANSDLNARWQDIKNQASSFINNLPDQFPVTGLITERPDGFRFGVWLMPDNQSHGMMETFLNFLTPDPNAPLVALADECCHNAKQQGAEYKDVHLDKAKIHTWLAWQDPPGRQLHDAVKQRILKADSPRAKPFVDWFRELYQI